MRILLTGDLVIDQPYSLSQISDEVISLFSKSDYNIVNLEAPVTDNHTKIVKTGPHLKSHKESTSEVLAALNVKLCTLANNHILDYDEKGVVDTVSFCRNIDVNTVGAGANRVEASKIFYIHFEDKKIAIINIAENEWSSSGEITAGANGMDLIEDTKKIYEAKKRSDFVFIIVHGGHEYYNLPSPRMQKQYRFYIDNGADLVVGHHTHCISGMETYKEKSIYYGLGNFLFTKPSQYNDWYSGIILDVEITNQTIVSRPLFVNQGRNNYMLSLLESESCMELEERFRKYSSVISDPYKLRESWIKYIDEKTKSYDNYWSPLSFIRNKYIKFALSKAGFNGSNNEGKSRLLNLMRCEAHADLSKEIIIKTLRKP